LRLGPCPICGHDLRIHHVRNHTQFIGCTHYPECTFNIGLPATMWGYAVRTDAACAEHGLHHVRLVRKGSRPWEIGCPLCHHIESLRETLSLLPSAGGELVTKMVASRLYSVQDLLQVPAEKLSEALSIPHSLAQQLQKEAGEALDLLRRRSDCRKFVRSHVARARGGARPLS